MISGHEEVLALDSTREKSSTKWDFELWRELNRLAVLLTAIRCGIIQEPLKMEDENERESLDQNLLARLTQARRTELDRLQMRDTCECVFYSVYRTVLSNNFCVSHQDTCVGKIGKGKSDLDVEMEGSPIFNSDSVDSIRPSHD